MAHINTLIDNTVAAYIVYGRSVLLIDHVKLKRWLPIGGHIELEDDPEEALFREIEEECGLTKDLLEVFGKKPEIISEGTKFLYAPVYLDIHTISENHRHIGMTYFVKALTQKIQLDEKEHNAIRWVSFNDLDSPAFNLLPAVRFYAKEAIEKLGWD